MLQLEPTYQKLKAYLEEIMPNASAAEVPAGTITLKDGRTAQVTVKIETDEMSFIDGIEAEITL